LDGVEDILPLLANIQMLKTDIVCHIVTIGVMANHLKKKQNTNKSSKTLGFGSYADKRAMRSRKRLSFAMCWHPTKSL
jgi:hypothetical protein